MKKNIDILLKIEEFERHLRQRLQFKPDLTCRNLYMQGHRGKRWTISHYSRPEVSLIQLSAQIRDDLPMIQAYLDNPVGTMARWVSLHRSTLRCEECGERLSLETDGQVVRVKTACQFPRGYPEWKVTIPVPSGRLVMGNSFHEWFPQVHEALHKDSMNPAIVSDISTGPGAQLYSYRYACAYLIVGFTGNECPGVYRATGRNDQFIVGQPKEGARLMEGTEEKVATIVTDFWGFSMADESTLLKSRPDYPIKDTVVEVPPGFYRMTYRRHRITTGLWDDHAERNYATIERIGDCV